MSNLNAPLQLLSLTVCYTRRRTSMLHVFEYYGYFIIVVCLAVMRKHRVMAYETSQRCQRRTDPWPQAICIYPKIGEVWTCGFFI